MKRFIAIGCLISFVSACAGAPTPPPVATATAFPTATALRTATALASATALPSATAFQTFTPQPTPTSAPTQTVPRPTATRTPTPTVAPSPTSATAGAELIVCTLLIAPGQPGPLYALLQDDHCFPSHVQSKFLVSNDYGKTWGDFAGGLPVASGCLYNINLDYAGTDLLYASTCQGLYRWRMKTWEQVSTQETEMVAIVYGQPQIIFATARPDHGGPVLRSTDGGKTWNSAASGLVHFAGVANIAIDPHSSNTLYGIIWPRYAGSYLRRGVATGSWSTMPAPLNNGQIEIGMTIDGATGALYVTAYNFFQSGSDIRYRMQIWRTSDPSRPDVNAVAWEQVSDFGENVIAQLLASGWSPQGLALYVRLSPTNCVSTDPKCVTQVQRSLNGGRTWEVMTIK